MSKALINNKILQWALLRSGLSAVDLAEKLSMNEGKLDAWLSGEELPTFKQAQRLASVLRIPFGFFYLSKPPAENIPVAEFRRLPNISKKINMDVFDLLSDIEFKRDWYKEYRTEEGFDKLDFVGKFEADAPTSLIASDVRRELTRSSNSLFANRKSYERFLAEFMKSAEKIGIWVMRSGVVGNNTHRTIPVKVLRGFAIADPLVPLIFLNGRDSKSAQIFTFAHELAHIWIGNSSIDMGDLSSVIPDGDPNIEKKCNEVAAEILVPSNEFVEQWQIGQSLYQQVDEVAEKFSVSRIVIARRAFEQGFISEDEYREFFVSETQRWAAMDTGKSSGGSFYNTVPTRNGRTFTNAVAREATVGRLLYRDAGRLLGVQPSKVRELYERSVS